ncbi:MAG: hypothetical protein ACYTAO_10565, partial [Planctomycetota bacterium]
MPQDNGSGKPFITTPEMVSGIIASDIRIDTRVVDSLRRLRKKCPDLHFSMEMDATGSCRRSVSLKKAERLS